MALALPDYNWAQAPLHGKLLPFGWLRLLWRLKVRRPRQGRLALLGVGKDFRQRQYAGLAYLDGQGPCYTTACHVGPNVTFGEQIRKVEAHLLDFDGDLYGEEIEVEFIEKLRHDATFADGESLAAQMHHDCAQVRGLLTMLAGGDPMARYPLGRALSGGTGL